MYQYFKRQLKTPACFGSFGIHPQEYINLNVIHAIKLMLDNPVEQYL